MAISYNQKCIIDNLFIVIEWSKCCFYQCEDLASNHIHRLICCFITILFFSFSINTPKSTPFFFCYPLKTVQIVHFPISSTTTTTRLHQVLPQDCPNIAMIFSRSLRQDYVKVWSRFYKSQNFYFVDVKK